MKTFLTGIAALFLATSLWADWPDRIVEFDVHSSITVGNNYFPFQAFFNSPLVVDLNNMAKTLTSDGLTLNTSNINRLAININPNPIIQGGIFMGTEAYGLTSLPPSLLSFLANGNGSSGGSISGGWNAQNLKADVFTDMGVWAGFKVKQWHFTVAPAVYFSLLHINNATANYSLSTSASGGTTASLQANIPVYSVFNLPTASTTGNYSAFSNFNAGDLFSSGGFDLSLEADYPLLKWLTVGGKMTNIPLVFAQLNHGSVLQSTQSFSTVDPSTNSGTPYTTSSTNAWTTALGPASVIRPFEARALAVIYPLKNLPGLSITPSLGLGVWDTAYLDGGLACELDLRHWAHFSLASDYKYGTWSQTFGLGFNVRVFELDLAIGGASTDLLGSFTDGVTAALDVKMGF